MGTTKTKSLNKYHWAKDHQLEAELKKVHKAFQEKPMTMSELDVYVGNMPKSICRYVVMLLIQGRIAIIKVRTCRITGFKNINVYTGNSKLFPKSLQLKKY